MSEGLHFLPAHYMPPGCKVGWPLVLALEVVGMFPPVQHHPWVEPSGQGAVLQDRKQVTHQFKISRFDSDGVLEVDTTIV